ncbi:MAG: sigma-70 family RNA polymerase sigma factor [Verrucomicrobiae bacterium]|nr:sigma-70 family RNA polymerase sigma factor [Verrucomicrobiae bacterium]NNJ43864.1 sigma-70 family RNA polymerase sigma factor [Akkermansiaceae bacterium]
MGHQSNTTSEFIKLLTGHQSSLRAYIVSLMPGSDDIDDVLQDTNVVLWKKMESFELGTHFQAWAFAIARNMVKANWKNKKRDLSPVLNQTVIDAVAQTWFQRDATHPSAKQAALDRCLKTLRESERALIDARYQSPKSLEKHAKVIGRSAESIRVSLFRIREKLRQCVQKRMATIEGGAA